METLENGKVRLSLVKADGETLVVRCHPDCVGSLLAVYREKGYDLPKEPEPEPAPKVEPKPRPKRKPKVADLL